MTLGARLNRPTTWGKVVMKRLYIPYLLRPECRYLVMLRRSPPVSPRRVTVTTLPCQTHMPGGRQRRQPKKKVLIVFMQFFYILHHVTCCRKTNPVVCRMRPSPESIHHYLALTGSTKYYRYVDFSTENQHLPIAAVASTTYFLSQRRPSINILLRVDSLSWMNDRREGQSTGAWRLRLKLSLYVRVAELMYLE